MGVRQHIAWLRRGPAGSDAAVASLGVALNDLQHKVEALTQVVARIDQHAGQDRAELASISRATAAISAELRVAVDDLGDRIGALAARR